jgi:hypothetical protein
MIVNTPQTFKQFIEKAQYETVIAFDTETTGIKPFHGDHIIGASFLLESDLSTYYIPIRHIYPDPNVNLSPDLFFSQLAFLFNALHLNLLVHNGKFDMKFIEKEGVFFQGKLIDTMILAHLHNENERELGGGYRLKEDLGKKYLSADADEEKIALSECADRWKASQIKPIQAEIDELETTMKLIERDWKNEQKEEIKEQLAIARKEYNAHKKIEGEDTVHQKLRASIINNLRGQVEDINHKNPKDYPNELPEYVPLAEKRKELMNRIQEIKDVDHMSKMAHYPLEVVGKYAEQDVKLTYGLYQFFRYGEKPNAILINA